MLVEIFPYGLKLSAVDGRAVVYVDGKQAPAVVAVRVVIAPGGYNAAQVAAMTELLEKGNAARRWLREGYALEAIYDLLY